MTKVFCAIDTDDIEIATYLAQHVGPITGGLKIGLEFFGAHGPLGVETLMEAAPDVEYFIDLKFHDIPNTVARAVSAVSARLKPAYLNVHASGGVEMMQAARDACSQETKLLAVTVLTSFSRVELGDIGIDHEPIVQVDRLARMTRQAGLDGVVCSADEISSLRDVCGDDFVLMVPGIRPEGSSADDQKRICGPKEALEMGANHLVIGRPITQADEPAEAAQKIMDEL